MCLAKTFRIWMYIHIVFDLSYNLETKEERKRKGLPKSFFHSPNQLFWMRACNDFTKSIVICYGNYSVFCDHIDNRWCHIYFQMSSHLLHNAIDEHAKMYCARVICSIWKLCSLCRHATTQKTAFIWMFHWCFEFLDFQIDFEYKTVSGILCDP